MDFNTGVWLFHASLDVSTDDRDSCSLVVHTDACRYIGVYFTLVNVSVIVDRDGCTVYM